MKNKASFSIRLGFHKPLSKKMLLKGTAGFRISIKGKFGTDGMGFSKAALSELY